jgi:ferredoxin
VKVRVDLDKCVGHGRCYDLAPHVFGEDPEGHCRVLREKIPPELEEQARLAADNCPEQAITISSDRA